MQLQDIAGRHFALRLYFRKLVTGTLIKRPSVEENTSPGEEAIVSLLGYGGVAYLLRLCLYPGGVGGSVIVSVAKRSPKASEIATARRPRNDSLGPVAGGNPRLPRHFVPRNDKSAPSVIEGLEVSLRPQQSNLYFAGGYSPGCGGQICLLTHLERAT